MFESGGTTLENAYAVAAGAIEGFRLLLCDASTHDVSECKDPRCCNIGRGLMRGSAKWHDGLVSDTDLLVTWPRGKAEFAFGALRTNSVQQAVREIVCKEVGAEVGITFAREPLGPVLVVDCEEP